MGCQVKESPPVTSVCTRFREGALNHHFIPVIGDISPSSKWSNTLQPSIKNCLFNAKKRDNIVWEFNWFKDQTEVSERLNPYSRTSCSGITGDCSFQSREYPTNSLLTEKSKSYSSLSPQQMKIFLIFLTIRIILWNLGSLKHIKELRVQKKTNYRILTTWNFQRSLTVFGQQFTFPPSPPVPKPN